MNATPQDADRERAPDRQEGALRSPPTMSTRDQIVAEIPRLRRYARALTADPVRADDLVQDTLERALSKFSLWRAGNLRAWLFAIMHNLFVNHVRASQPVDFVDDESLPEVAVRAAQADVLELRDLGRALQRLAPEQREVLLLVGLEELSYEDAATALGVPVGTVMSRLSRARERLRAILAGQAVGPEASGHLKVVK